MRCRCRGIQDSEIQLIPMDGTRSENTISSEILRLLVSLQSLRNASLSRLPSRFRRLIRVPFFFCAAELLGVEVQAVTTSGCLAVIEPAGGPNQATKPSHRSAASDAQTSGLCIRLPLAHLEQAQAAPRTGWLWGSKPYAATRRTTHELFHRASFPKGESSRAHPSPLAPRTEIWIPRAQGSGSEEIEACWRLADCPSRQVTPTASTGWGLQFAWTGASADETTHREEKARLPLAPSARIAGSL